MIKITATVRENNVTKVLTIHSKNLAHAINKTNRKVSLSDYKDGLLLKPHGSSHATLVKNKRIQIALKTLAKKGVINKDNLNKKHLFIYLEPLDWKIEEFFEKSRGNPMTEERPNDLTIKKAGLRTNKRDRYFIDISSKKLFELSKKSTIRCLINRKENFILIRSIDPAARKLTPHGKRRVQISIPKNFLTKSEIIDLDKNSWLPIEIALNLDSFGLKITDFYSIKEENDLAEYLIKEKLNVKIKDYRDPYDLEIPEKKIAIEVRNSMPLKEDFSTRHKIRPAMVRLRILEAEFFLKNLGLNSFYLIINKEWENKKYITELTNKIDKRVKVYYTKFEKNWAEETGKKIIGNLVQI